MSGFEWACLILLSLTALGALGAAANLNALNNTLLHISRQIEALTEVSGCVASDASDARHTADRCEMHLDNIKTIAESLRPKHHLY